VKRAAGPRSTGEAGIHRAGERQLVSRGIAWNAAYQLAEVAFALGAMLILARIIPPAEYGRAGAVVGLLTLLNAFSFAMFAGQALQLPDGREPDWSLHWSAGFYVQISLMLACHAVAGLLWLAETYRPIAPLLHLAALGFVVDWPAQMEIAMLTRALDFRRLKIALACCTVLRLGITIGAALAGAGAVAIVLGANVVAALPLAVDLLIVRRWRPAPGWWRWPDWNRYRPAIRFGFQQSASALLAGVRGALEAAVLPASVGYPAIGLLGRARALLGATAGRMGNVLHETGYPLLPRYAADPARYAPQATLFAQAVLLALVPAILYVGVNGAALSRVLYGERWIAADPLIWPAAIGAVGLAIFGAATSVLLGASRLRICLWLDAVAAAISLAMVSAAWTGRGVVVYTWALGVGQLAAGGIALAAASRLLDRRWIRLVLLPPILCGALASAAMVTAGRAWAAEALGVRLGLDTCVYAIALVSSLRALFPRELGALLVRVPGGRRVGTWMRLGREGPALAAP
jgi:polysaccharide transporter, PST family